MERVHGTRKAATIPEQSTGEVLAEKHPALRADSPGLCQQDARVTPDRPLGEVPKSPPIRFLSPLLEVRVSPFPLK